MDSYGSFDSLSLSVYQACFCNVDPSHVAQNQEVLRTTDEKMLKISDNLVYPFRKCQKEEETVLNTQPPDS